jgi:arabinogalactan oligomer/maltooligosaccharide transport system permease protein
MENRKTGALRNWLTSIIPWGLLAAAVFFATNPYLWPDPLNRLHESVFYHAGYATTSVEVQHANYPFYQPLVYLLFSPYWWGGYGIFFFPIDPVITLFAVFGLKRLWKKERLYVLWIFVALAFLFVWPTKWAQYIVMFTAPLAFSAAEGFMATVVDPLRAWWARRSEKPAAPQTHDLRRAWAWLIPGLLAFTILTLFPLLFQFGVSLTNFSNHSIRDGLQGGLWRAIFGGLTGQIPAVEPEFPFQTSQVDYIGPVAFLPLLGYITNPNFGMLTFNLLWMVFSVTLQSALGLGVALLLWQRGVRLGKFWQALFIIPWAIPEMIGALMWSNIFQPEWGWLALAVKQYGAGIPFGFLANWTESANLWMVIYLLPAMWYGFPFMMMASSTALRMIPDEVFDAAAIDGANTWQIFHRITWPLILPLLLPAIIVRGIFAFNQFYLFQAFYNLEATLSTMSYNIFNSGGFHPWGGQFAISSVVNVINVLILVGFVILFNRWSKAGEGVTYA